MRSIALLFLILILAAARPIESGPAHVCRGGESSDCPQAPLEWTDLDEPATIVRTVRVDPAALPLPRPPMVWVIALASSEVRWNGAVIGRNGSVGPDRAREVPGRYVATFEVPANLVRPGDNRLEVRLSAQHLWLPVRAPIHNIDVGLYETPILPGLRDYLPALLMLGAFLAALFYFGAAALADRQGRDGRLPRLLAIVSAAAIAQLLVEVSRTFIAYTYPWHLARVTAVALFAGVAAVAIADYAAIRFAPAQRRAILITTASAATLSIVLIPYFDLKALGAILAGALALLAAGAIGARASKSGARFAIAAALVMMAVMAWELTGFLDRGYYLLLAPMLVALIAEQIASLRRARADRDREARRAAALADRLARAEREGEPIVALKDGSRTHRVAESEILFVRAADDYCDVTLKDGRTMLVTMSLARFVGALPARFVRVHKSFAVNRAHVIAVAPKPGGGRMLTLSEGTAIPIGRSYEKLVGNWAG